MGSSVRRFFLDERRLAYGTWHAFERDVARMLVQNGFEEVRLVGGAGDHGGDVLARKDGRDWVFQCKYRLDGYAPANAADEVVRAAQFYGADRLAIATTRPAGPALQAAIDRWAQLGVTIELLSQDTLMAIMDASPEYALSRRKLHRYQKRCVERVLQAMRRNGRAQIILATGLGKTVLMAEVTACLFQENRIADGRVLVLADKVDLVDQLQREFWRQIPKSVATHLLRGGESPGFWDGITFATVQSAQANQFDLPSFGLVWVDEAHHIGSETFRRLIEHLNPAMLGGATATPWRGDRFDINELLGAPVVRMGIAEGLRNGFLCPVDYRLMADDIDWRLVREQSLHSYSLRELNTRLLIPIRDAEAAKRIADVFAAESRHRLIVFCASIAHAREFTATLSLFGFEAGVLASPMRPADRERMLSRFRKGELNAITAVDIFNEGIDVPDVDMIAFMRVTHSWRIFVQQAGRGLRVAHGKDKLLVLDFVSNLRRLIDVLALHAAASYEVERMAVFEQLVQFSDRNAGNLMFEWMMDQANLFSRVENPSLATIGRELRDGA